MTREFLFKDGVRVDVTNTGRKNPWTPSRGYYWECVKHYNGKTAKAMHYGWLPTEQELKRLNFI